ncbi:type IV pilus modification protein PilV [Halomonas sp.]|uniref:type IV pilus modification protein PilV n=1 Tax=Halomonas sp. TaxID=1486246 RepID=UPI00298DDEB2|nr:type IV pilus modification protein PilV [Halomonas sp.]MDW7746180.1 type IV pilus modification protein PilV [Halomonas sp.]
MRFFSVKKKSCGFTLIEALVAILVLAVGLLGVAAMQIKAMQSSHAAYQRSVATLAAQDAVERLWASASEKNGKCDDIVSMEDWDAGNYWPDWHDVWITYLPGLNVIGLPNTTSVAGDECRFDIVISWDDERFVLQSNNSSSVEDVSTLKYVVKIPAVPAEIVP